MRSADHGVDRVFVDRWPSRAMPGETIDEAAVGKPGPVDCLPERLRPREMPNARRPLSQIVGEGRLRL
jgi:hypothetical protein